MPFPFVFHENFEAGTSGGFTQPANSDDLGRIDFPDHRDDLGILPWRGGYVMRVDLNRGTNLAYIQNDTALDMINGDIRYIRFYLYIGDDFRAPDFNGSSVRILEFHSATGVEGGIGITCSEADLQGPRLAIWSSDESTPQFVDGLAFEQGVWLPLQVIIEHRTTTGQIKLQLGDNMLQVNRMAMDSFTHFRLGSMSQNPKIRGTLYFDDFIIDTAKLENPVYLTQDQLWGNSQLYTKSSYAFVGPGTLRGATLIGSGSGANTAFLYDTDRLPLAYHDIKGALKVAVGESKDMLIDTVVFERGCYIQMQGTDPQVIVHYGERGAV